MLKCFISHLHKLLAGDQFKQQNQKFALGNSYTQNQINIPLFFVTKIY